MAIGLLARIAAAGPAPTYLLALGDRRRWAGRLQLDPHVDLVQSPRHASILLVASAIPEEMESAAKLIHDQIPHLRAVVDLAENTRVFPDAIQASEAHATTAARDAFRSLQTGAITSSPPLLPTENPVEWQGKGPHGQGGKGMMGGKPYGRKMAMTAEDVRDGLQLDRVQMTLGPFLPWMPAGLELSVVLQGDLLQEATIGVPGTPQNTLPAVFERAITEPVRIADLELARARHHLGACAELLSLHGLNARAANAHRLAENLKPGRSGPIKRFARSLKWSLAMQPGAHGVGPLDASMAAGLGCVARASGLKEDARLDDPAYADLGFSPITHKDGDALARFRQRLAEAAQSVDLAGRAGDKIRPPGPPCEGPWGPLKSAARGQNWQQIIDDTAPGMPWDAFVTTFVSLDLNPAAFSPTDNYASARVGRHVDGADGDSDHEHHAHGGH